MDTQLLMQTAMQAGSLMLAGGAETYRVEDTMRHILRTAERLETAEVLVLMTGITATLKVEGEPAISLAKRVEGISTNLKRVVEVNEISRRYCGGDLSLEEAFQQLRALPEQTFRRLEYHLAVVGTCAGFALFFGGGLWDAAASLVVGLALALCLGLGKKYEFHAFIQNGFGAVVVAFVSILLKTVLGGRISMDLVMISGIMPLVPGVAITNGVRDTLRGDYLSGVARILEAFLKAAGIALGIGIGLALFSRIFSGGGILL